MTEKVPSSDLRYDLACPCCGKNMHTCKCTGLAAQIREARRSIASWPKWMRDTAYFAGSNAEGVCNVD